MIFLLQKKSKQIGNCEVNFDVGEFHSILRSSKSVCPSVVFFYVC